MTTDKINNQYLVSKTGTVYDTNNYIHKILRDDSHSKTIVPVFEGLDRTMTD